MPKTLRDALDSEVGLRLERQNPRDSWENKTETFLSAMGAVIGLGNIWRFPYITYKYGGGAFLIPYLVFVILCGFPMFFLETSLGQFTQQGAVQAWTIVPIMKGVGLGSGFIGFFCNLYYITVMAWALLYFVQSLRTTQLPWMRCDQWFNTNSCITYKAAVDTNFSNFNKEANRSLPIFEYWNNYILRRSDNLDEIGGLENWPMIMSMLICWIMVYFCIFRGTKSTGKVVYFTAIFPYVLLVILLVRGCTLPGSLSGIYFYLKPNISEILRAEVWVNAGSQVCYSYAICFSVLVAYGSFSKFDSDCYKRTFYLSLSCSLTSFLSGFAVFGVLGNMSEVLKVEVKDVVQSGPGLAFIVYPTALTFMPFPQFWNACFFLMIILLAIDSQFCCMEGVLTIFYDSFEWPRKNRMLFSGLACIGLFISGLMFVTPSGIYIFELFNNYSVSGITLLWLVSWQSIGIGWLYGSRSYYDIIKDMIGYYPSPYLSICFRFATPALSTAVMVFYITQYEPLETEGLRYPLWANLIGWCLCLTSFLCVPFWALYELLKRKGSLRKRFYESLKPQIPVPIRDTKPFTQKVKLKFLENKI